MLQNKPCTVAFLLPPETSYTAFFRQQNPQAQASGGAEEFNPYVDEWCDEFRERIAEIGEEEGIMTEVQEHQLFDEAAIPGRKTRRALQEEADIIATIDPPPALSAFVLGTVKRQPHMRSVLAFSTRDGMEESFHALGTARVPVLIMRAVRVGLIYVLEREASLRMVPKMFAFLQCNEDQRDRAITQALRYPDCADMASQWYSFTPGTSSPRSEPA